MVYQAARAVKIPIIGLGGISTTEDALEFFIAGARAVQVGTANFYDPGASVRIVQGLRNYCQRKRLHLSAIIGSLKIPERAPPIGAGN
jgi:dihydroorotate dehydrogenase (NAD+) catalytic subunit